MLPDLEIMIDNQVVSVLLDLGPDLYSAEWRQEVDEMIQELAAQARAVREELAAATHL